MFQIKPLKHKALLIALIAIGLSSCKTNPYALNKKVYNTKAKEFAKIIRSTPPTNQLYDSLSADNQQWIGSVNFGIRKPNFVVIHHTAQNSLEQTIKTFSLSQTGTSSHYIVSRDGKVVQMVNDYLRANHAGIGKWGKTTDLNSASIGIELDNNGTTDPWTAPQINSLMKLLTTLKTKYNIPTENFIGHADIAPRRKNDPKNFPWRILAESGFGYWYDAELATPPADFNAEMALRYIGYNTRDLPAAIEAFKVHFIQSDTTPELTDFDKCVLYNLYTKY